jgi:hypothetical protein
MSVYRIADRVVAFTSEGPVTWVDGGAAPAPGTPVGGLTRDVYAYLNSLRNHDAGAGNANTSTGNWLARMAAQAPSGGNTYTGPWMFGFANGWTIPPSAQGEEEVTSPYMSGTGWTGASAVEIVEMVPDNFEGRNYAPNVANGLGFTYTTRLLQIIDAWEANAPNANRVYAIYSGLPPLPAAPASVSPAQRAAWIADGINTGAGGYRAWMLSLVAALQAARPALTIRLHDVSRAVLLADRDTVVGTIPLASLFEDDAPHGLSTNYFLLGVADYIELFNEKPPENFTFNPAWNVHPTVTSNYQTLVDFIWGVLRP